MFPKEISHLPQEELFQTIKSVPLRFGDCRKPSVLSELTLEKIALRGDGSKVFQMANNWFVNKPMHNFLQGRDTIPIEGAGRINSNFMYALRANLIKSEFLPNFRKDAGIETQHMPYLVFY